MLSFGKWRKIACVFLACAFCSVSAFSQENSDWYIGKTISQISFEGLRSVKKSEVSGVTGSFKILYTMIFLTACMRLVILKISSRMQSTIRKVLTR